MAKTLLYELVMLEESKLVVGASSLARRATLLEVCAVKLVQEMLHYLRRLLAYSGKGTALAVVMASQVLVALVGAVKVGYSF